MKTNYTDAELQAAIDEACDKLAQSTRVYLNALDLDQQSEVWAEETPARLQLIKAALASLPEPVDEESMLLNLLAVIHRDGGHHQAEHGTRKAVEDACKEWARLISIVEETEPKQSLSQLRPIADIQLTAAKADDLAKPDPYAELKAAHAEGKVIEARLINTPLPYGWIVSENPVWDSNCEYRIKPEPETFEPTPEPLVTKPISLPTVDGMSLRDWFAGQALQQFVAERDHSMWAHERFFEARKDIATAAYNIADAMLAAREVKP